MWPTISLKIIDLLNLQRAPSPRTPLHMRPPSPRQQPTPRTAPLRVPSPRTVGGQGSTSVDGSKSTPGRAASPRNLPKQTNGDRRKTNEGRNCALMWMTQGQKFCIWKYLQIAIIEWQTGWYMYASFFERARHQGIFSLVKGTFWGNCKFLDSRTYQGH